MGLIQTVFVFVSGILRNRMELAADNLAFRQQLPAPLVVPENTIQPKQIFFTEFGWNFMVACVADVTVTTITATPT